jgi:hypothetical protein
MVKKMLLSALFCASTIATAQISLDLNLTVKNSSIERNATGTVVVDENATASVMFDGFDSLVIDFTVQQSDDIVTIKTQFFQKTETDELVSATEILTVQVPFDQSAIVTVNEESNTPDNDGSLVLVITPTLVE